jgi:hypothetical protein
MLKVPHNARKEAVKHIAESDNSKQANTHESTS